MISDEDKAADQSSHARRLTKSETELLAEGRQLSCDVEAWVRRYDRRGKTYRQFWADYSVVATRFENFFKREDLPEQTREDEVRARDVAIHLGFDPESHCPSRELDDLIIVPDDDV